MVYAGDAKTLTVGGSSTILGKYDTVTVSASSVTAQKGTEIGSLTLDARKGSFVLDGTAKDVTINPKYVTLSGGGYAEHILVHGKGYTITCKYGKLDEELDRGLSGTKLTLSSGQTVSSTAPTATISATVTGVDTGYGAESSCQILHAALVCRRQPDPVPRHLHPGGDDKHIPPYLLFLPQYAHLFDDQGCPGL